MKPQLWWVQSASVIAFAIFVRQLQSAPAVVYQNNFDDASSSLNGLIITNPVYNFGTYSVAVESGQLRIDTFEPHPTAAIVALSSEHVFSPYLDVLKNNPGIVTWAFNVSNQDSGPNVNNVFYFTFVSSTVNTEGQSYSLGGGGYVTNQMLFYRGSGATSGTLLTITNGLDPLPSHGSFRVTYEPANDRWTIYGVFGSSYVDPLGVTNLLGSVIDGTLTSLSPPYMIMSANNTGSDFFD